jgi:hypothetical protein
LPGPEALDEQPSEQAGREFNDGRKIVTWAQRRRLDPEQPRLGGAPGQDQPGQRAQSDSVCRDLGEPRLHFIGAEKRDGAWRSAEIRRVEENEMRASRDFDAADPLFGVETREGDAGDLHCFEALGEAQADGIVTAVRVAQPEPKDGCAGEGIEALAEV